MKDSKVYSDSYQLTILTFHRTKSFPRHLRPTLGRSLEEKVLELSYVIRKSSVYTGRVRLKYLKLGSSALDEIKILGQMATDLKGFTTSSYHEFSKLTAEIGRELGGFIKYESRKGKDGSS